jgi:diguanylate cyclase (GGDEF)-like protein
MKILTADDNQNIREQLIKLLKEAFPETKILEAKNGLELLAMAEKEEPDLIISDIQMPQMTGYEALRILQAQEKTKNIPVIFLTGTFQEDEDIAKGLELGAVEYVTKPINKTVFIARVKVMLRLKAQQERILQLSNQDPLTESYNRRFLYQRLKEEYNRCQRQRNPIAGIMSDLDHFKKINDTYGHEAGDLVLIKLVKSLSISMRNYDVLSRYGGEEFFVLLPSTDGKSAIIIAERMREIVEKMTIDIEGKTISITSSFGVSSFEGYPFPQDPELLLKWSDIALYEAKRKGRNRVEYYSEEKKV